ncbi:MAG: hypothetical protein WC548_01610 [Candidatus Pacearchaeota archaeon]
MKQIFILGRNPKLSREEIVSYIMARENYKEVFFDENFLLVEVLNEVNIQELGGTIKSGKIIFEGKNDEFRKFLDTNEIIPSDKFSYSILGNGEYEILQEKFKSEKKKAVLKHGRKKIRFQDGDDFGLARADYTLFLHDIKGIVYFGEINKEYSYLEIKKRDMGKPVRREEFAISPRLAKILINLSGVRAGQHLVDPFCGIGGIVIESLIKGINVTGIDNDRAAIENAKKNIEWLKQNFEIKSRYTLINSNSNSAPDMQFDGVATETPLGELFKKKPSDKEAKEIMVKFEDRIIPILRRLSRIKKHGAKIAITFPVIRNFKPDEKMIANESGLRIISGPILESRPEQFISREILVME